MKKSKPAQKTVKKRPLSELELAECRRLNAIYQSKKRWLKERGVANQAETGSLLDMGQAAVSQYLNGINALNKEVAVKWAKLLEIDVTDFSERLAEELHHFAESIPKQTGSRKKAKPGNISSEFDGKLITASEATLLRLLRRIPDSAKPRAVEAVEAILKGYAIS